MVKFGEAETLPSFDFGYPSLQMFFSDS